MPKERMRQLEGHHLAALTSSNRGGINCSSLIVHDGTVDKRNRKRLVANREKSHLLKTIREFCA